MADAPVAVTHDAFCGGVCNSKQAHTAHPAKAGKIWHAQFKDAGHLPAGRWWRWVCGACGKAHYRKVY